MWRMPYRGGAMSSRACFACKDRAEAGTKLYNLNGLYPRCRQYAVFPEKIRYMRSNRPDDDGDATFAIK